MALPAWHEEAIAKHHRRAEFDCGEPELDTYLARYARQAHERGAAKTFLAIADDEPPGAVLGFYSVSPASLAFHDTPDSVRQGLARHEVPVFRLARLAVNRPVQGQGLGGQLLLAAGRRCLRAASQTGGVALLIDAKSDRAAQWYEAYGAVARPDRPHSLLLPFATLCSALSAAGRL
ncbi:MAG: GNAT family N-acetyltransferase [Pseudomonadota bacterium]|nr:GNAT family N-acetyltransferase [Pseudomonadota bacterium]